MSVPLLSVEELKARGWTPAMIRDLLQSPDQEEPNPQQLERSLETRDRALPLYLETRVIEAEAAEGFTDAWARGQLRLQAAARGAQARQQRQAAQLARHAAVPMLTLIPPDLLELWTLPRLWTHHLVDYHRWCAHGDPLLISLPRALVRQAERHMFERYRLVFQALYGEGDVRS
jgi:hypothetical protein